MSRTKKLAMCLTSALTIGAGATFLTTTPVHAERVLNKCPPLSVAYKEGQAYADCASSGQVPLFTSVSCDAKGTLTDFAYQCINVPQS